MDALKFVEELRRFVIDENHEQYIKSIRNINSEGVTDEYWRSAIKTFNHLDADAQEIFSAILRKVQVDTMSLILGILDGNMILENQEKDFSLTTVGEKEPINGTLQEMFLALEEEETSE